MSASDFKAKCLACLGEIEQTGEPITITRRGRAIAVLGPVRRAALKSPRDSWAAKIQILGDIVNTNIFWEAAESK
jgi:antitoxin (DNA-binding transcriptional repressor) of toxin-antitoxin stability system